VFAGGDDFVRPVVDARATIESEPVVRKSSEVLRLVDDVVDAALILDVNLGVRAHLRDHRESLGEWGVRVVLVGDPLGKRVGHAEPSLSAAIGGCTTASA